MPDQPQLRPARKSDSRTIARLHSIASDGVADYIWTQRAEQDARSQGYSKTSLIVFARNELAKALYERLGYREVAREPIVPHPLIHFTGAVRLMVKHL